MIARRFYVIFAIVLVTLLLCVSSCIIPENSHGLATKVVMSKGGDTLKFSTDGEEILGAEIYDSDGRGETNVTVVNDTTVYSYDWLTVRNKYPSRDIIIEAAESPQRKNRTLYVEINFGYDYALIKVVQ